MTNGGTGPFLGKLVFVNSGRGPIPPSLVLVDPADPSNTTVLLDNFFGRQFNSLNDVKIYPGTNKLFFTDVTCVAHRRSPSFSRVLYAVAALTCLCAGTAS